MTLPLKEGAVLPKPKVYKLSRRDQQFSDKVHDELHQQRKMVFVTLNNDDDFLPPFLIVAYINPPVSVMRNGQLTSTQRETFIPIYDQWDTLSSPDGPLVGP
ncbi:uncharacterized protein PGRI_010500 [Penicillium griseofulvum]|uniref:Uncharacterized protein n=1 Tax=Penicillium patulum TaxID=5078 RepID=A0A135LYG7_PENPA|nr:uncharacterized protein PGRI_010500 [Penicillium griseofulvum]KXG54000.1 hypothetical protein PGRI_010500 [Penicillium griseofulvum]